MQLSQNIKSILCIIGGILLLLSASEIIFRLLLAVIGGILIAYGLRLRTPQRQEMPFMFIIHEWFFRR